MAQAGDMGVTGKRVYTGWIREDQPNILLVVLSLLGASEASCVMGQSSVERPLGWVSCALFPKVSVGGVCLLLPRGLSLPLLEGM